MSKFVDCLGREWTLRLTLGHRPPLKELGIDTSELGKALATLTEATGADVDKLAAVCHLLTVEPVTIEEYARGWDAVTVELAGEALADAVTDFFLGRRPKLAAAVKAKVKEVMAKMDATAAEALTRSASGTS